MTKIKTAQDREEFDQFCKLLVAENVRSYLEIGSWKGGSIQLVGQILPKGSRIVSVDRKAHQELLIVLNQLKQDGFDTHRICGDSADAKTIAAANALGPYDAVFIDGDHRLDYVRSDWNNYGPMGRIVGFHDIGRDIMPGDPKSGPHPHQVCSFWAQLDKSKYQPIEFISELTRTRTDHAAYGIGVLLRQ